MSLDSRTEAKFRGKINIMAMAENEIFLRILIFDDTPQYQPSTF